MKKEIIDKALFIIEERGQKAESEARANIEKAFKDRNFKELYFSYQDAIIAPAKDDILKEKNLKNKIDKKLEELKVGNILPQYSCSICNDHGYTNGQMCRCLKDEINKLLIKESGFKNLESFNNANFDLFENKDLVKKIYQKMQKWCYSDFKKNLIFISGHTGTGKTHLTKCMANELINQGFIVSLKSAFAMNQDFLKSYSSRDVEEKEALINKYLTCEVLFIDDLGTENRVKGITNAFLYQIINERQNKNMPTIISSNLMPNDIVEFYDERIYSRIIDQKVSICLLFDWQDLRRKKDR